MAAPPLVADLVAALGADAVKAEPLDLRLFSKDAGVTRGEVRAVTFPEDAAGVAAVIRVAKQQGIPVVARGAGPANWISPEAEGWFIPEANVHTRSTWFWSTNSDHTLKSLDGLMQVYYESIGRGANLLVNMTPDPRGLLPEAEVKRLAEFGVERERRFGKVLAETPPRPPWTRPREMEITWPTPQRLHHVVAKEDLTAGQHILQYAVDARIDGQ